ncbi:APC family permease [Phenylobacterium sp.]|uniref:APC family permease n=1 Tax=Phenylobacterium sp. TaxID=1871053 RepID=UPI0035C790E2
MTEPSVTAAGLKRGVRLIDVIMLGAGTAIGAAIFTVLGPAAQVGGSGILIATALAAVPMGLFALVYAYLSSTAPRTAASYEWQRQFTSPSLAFAIVWMRVLSNAVVMIVLARVLTNYLSMVVDFPATPAILAMFAAIFALNYVGVAVAARAQTILMFLLLGALAVFVAAAAPSFRPALFVEAAEGGLLPIVAALPLMIQLFLGIETATEVGEEVADAKRVVPLGMAGALALTVFVYLTVTFAALSLVGPQVLAGSTAPLLDAAKVALGPFATPLIVTAAVFALAKSMNAVFLVYARFLFAMGRTGVLPAALGAVHPRFGTPHVATIVAFCACVAAVFLPSSLLFLLLAVNVPTMMKYMGTCLAAFSVARNHPEVHAEARLRFSRATVQVLSALGVLAAVGIAALGLETDKRPYALLLAWLVIGLLWYAWTTRKGRGAAATA